MTNNKPELVQWIEFLLMSEGCVSLVALERNKTVPFDIKRVYYIFGTQGVLWPQLGAVVFSWS